MGFLKKVAKVATLGVVGGPLAAQFGSAAKSLISPKIPGMPDATSEEVALQRAQREVLEQQRTLTQQAIAQQKAIMPLLFKELGLNAQFDTQGNVVNLTRMSGTTPNTQARTATPEMQEIERLMTERQLKALRGETEVDPTLERELSRQELTLRETLRRNLGTGYETSSAGIETLGDFAKRSAELRYGVARDERTLGEQLLQARSGFNLDYAGNLEARDMDRRSADLNYLLSSLSAPLTFASMPLSALQGLNAAYPAALAPYQAQRGMEYQARVGQQAARTGAIGRIAGIGLGAFLGGPVGAGIGGSVGGSLGSSLFG